MYILQCHGNETCRKVLKLIRDDEQQQTHFHENFMCFHSHLQAVFFRQFKQPLALTERARGWLEIYSNLAR